MTGLPEVMVNFVTSSYKPDLLKVLVDKVSAFPEVVGTYVFQFFTTIIHPALASPHVLLP